jgi:hypothetical protein
MVIHPSKTRAITMNIEPRGDLHTAIVWAFSYFRVPSPGTGFYSPCARLDPGLKRTMEGLLTHAELNVKVDTWARYLLLIGREVENGEKREAVLRELDTPELRATVSSAVQQARSHNLLVQQIYHYLLKHHDDPSISPFSSSPRCSQDLLAAHLQKIGWHSAKRSYDRIAASASLKCLFSVEDIFQITSEKASKPIDFLKPFELSRRVEIRTYAKEKFYGAVTDTIRTLDREQRTQNKSSDGVLTTVSEKELREALAHQGHSEGRSTHMCLIWRGYKDIYPYRKDHRGRLQPPTFEELALMCDRANQFRERERDRLNQQLDMLRRSQKASMHSQEEQKNLEAMVECLSAAVDLEEVKRSLAASVEAIRKYRHPEFIDNCKIDEVVVYQPCDSTIEEDKLNLEQIFLQAFSRLDTTAQNILKLYFGFGMNQSDVVSIFRQAIQVSEQWEVSRRIKDYQKSLLIAFVQISQKGQASPKVPKITNQMVSQLNSFLKPCLTTLCQQGFDAPLNSWLDSLDTSDRSTLYQHYSHQPKDNRCVDEAYLHCQDLMQRACQHLKDWIEAEFDVDLGLCSAPEKKLKTFVESWLDERLHLLLLIS